MESSARATRLTADRRRVVEVAGDVLGQQVGGLRQPVGAVFRAEVLVLPVGLVAVEELVEMDRLAEVHPDLAKTLLQGADHLEQVEDRLLLLGRAAQFAEVGAAFQHALVADVDRHEDDRPARVTEEAAQGDGEHAGAWVEHAPGARTAALDEVLGGEAAGEQGVQVLVEHRGVELVALEAAAHEEGPAAAQDRADHRHVQVDPGGDVRRGQAVAEQQVGEQQVVDVAAVAGHVDDLVALGHVLHPLDVVDLDPFVQLVPEPAEDDFEEADHRIGEVRGDFIGVAQRDAFGLLLGYPFALAFLADRLAYQRRAQQALDQVAAVRQVGTDHRGLQVAEVHPEDTVDHAQRALVALALFHQLAQVDRRGELHTGLASEDQDARQLAQAPGDRPVVGEQQLPGARFAVRRLSPEHADRNDLRVVETVLADRGEHAHQGRRGAALILAAEPVGFGRQVEERRRLDGVAYRYRHHRTRQPGLAAFGIHYREIADRRLLQHVEHRLAAVDLQGEGRLVDGFRAYPEVQQAAQGAKTKAAERVAGHTVSTGS